MKAAIYARVSTNDKGQNPLIQVEELRRYCTARGWEVVEEIVDHGYSGASDRRPGLKRLMGLAASRQVDVIAVTKLDRFARSIKHLVEALDEFASLGVLFVSAGDQIDLTTASGRLMTHLLGAFAQFERCLLAERTRSGLEFARSQGKVLGRPRRHDPAAILELRKAGYSYRAISKRLRVPMGSITRAIRGAHKSPSKADPENSIKTRGRHV